MIPRKGVRSHSLRNKKKNFLGVFLRIGEAIPSQTVLLRGKIFVSQESKKSVETGIFPVPENKRGELEKELS